MDCGGVGGKVGIEGGKSKVEVNGDVSGVLRRRVSEKEVASGVNGVRVEGVDVVLVLLSWLDGARGLSLMVSKSSR